MSGSDLLIAVAIHHMDMNTLRTEINAIEQRQRGIQSPS